MKNKIAIILIIITTLFVISGCRKNVRQEETIVIDRYVTLPDISNISKEEALIILEDLNLDFDFKDENSNEIENGYIIGYQNYIAGDKVEKDKFIYIYVSIGPSKIIIDDYYGKNIDVVGNKLKYEGIQVIKTPIEVNIVDYDDVYEGMIIDQDKEKGTLLYSNDVIELYYAVLK